MKSCTLNPTRAARPAWGADHRVRVLKLLHERMLGGGALIRDRGEESRVWTLMDVGGEQLLEEVDHHVSSKNVEWHDSTTLQTRWKHLEECCCKEEPAAEADGVADGRSTIVLAGHCQEAAQEVGPSGDQAKEESEGEHVSCPPLPALWGDVIPLVATLAEAVDLKAVR